MSWRDRARPIIAEVLRATAGQDEAAVRQALRDAYPFGARELHPYKVWLDEIKRQRGTATKRAAKAAEQAASGDLFEPRGDEP
jgi:hypothetical protein